MLTIETLMSIIVNSGVLHCTLMYDNVRSIPFHLFVFLSSSPMSSPQTFPPTRHHRKNVRIQSAYTHNYFFCPFKYFSTFNRILCWPTFWVPFPYGSVFPPSPSFSLPLSSYLQHRVACLAKRRRTLCVCRVNYLVEFLLFRLVYFIEPSQGNIQQKWTLTKPPVFATDDINGHKTHSLN